MSAEATGWVWRYSPWRGENHVRFLLHLAVADVVNDTHDHRFWMAQATLADKVGCKRATVNEWLRDALELGMLEMVEDNASAGRPNVYRFAFAGEGGVRDTDRGCPSDGQGGVRETDTKLKIEPNRTQQDTSTGSEAEIAARVVDAWVEATGRDPARVKVNAKRLATVKARLREGYSEDDLVAAARGIALSAWHMGDNPDRKRYDDLLVAIRDGGRVEKFRDLFLEGGDRTGDSRARSATAEALRRRGDR